MTERSTEAEDIPVARQRICRCISAPFGSSGERLMTIRVWPCASTTDRQPPRTYYQVLDISTDEQDAKVIEEAALRCSSHERTYQLTFESECTLRLNEVARAMITLLDPVLRREYDLSLAKPLSTALPERRRPGERDTPLLLQGKSAPPAPGEDTRVLLTREEGTCDVKLVYRRDARRKPGPWTG
jgi:hypothetical protein